MGVETNTYDIPELVLGDTFFEWFTLTNNEIINKLNRLEIYTPFSAGGSAGDGISAGTDSTGALHIEVISPIQKDMVFNGNLTVNGNTTTINSTDFTVDDFNIVLGATAGNTANDQEIMDFSGNSAGGGFIIRGSSGDKEFLWKYTNAAFNINQNLDFADQKSISSSGDGVRIATGASGGNATKGLIVGFTAGTTGGVTGSNTLIRTFNTDLGAGVSADALYVNDDGYVSIVNGANKITVDQTSHGLSFGMPVYMNTSTGNYTKAIANSAATSEVIGVVSRVYNDNKFELSLSGEIIGDFSQINDGNAALIAGQAYFVSTGTDGKISPIKPTNEDFFQKAVLIGLTSDRAIVKNFIGAEIAQEQRAADALVSNKIQIEQAGHGFTNGHALYYDGVNNQYRVAESQDGLDEVVGIVEKINSSNVFEMVLSGQIRFPEVTGHGCNAMTAGDTHYIKPSGTNGTFANVISESNLTAFNTGDVNKPLFVATSQNTAIVTNLRGIIFDDTEENNTLDVPVGAIMAFSGTRIPDGYALCNGDYLNIADFSDLYKHFEDAGFPFADDNEPSGTFKLPDLRDRFIIGKGTNPDSGDRKGSDELGKAGGLAEVTLAIDEMPKHSHIMGRPGGLFIPGSALNNGELLIDQINTLSHERYGQDPIIPDGFSESDNEIFDKQASEPVYSSAAGGPVSGSPNEANPHENRPPYLTLVWIIRTKGVNTLLDGTQILGGDSEFVTVGTPSHNDDDSNGVLETQLFVGSHGSQVKGADKSPLLTVLKEDLAEAGTNGIFADQIREVTVKFVCISSAQIRTRLYLYYKFPDGELRKVCEFDDPAGTDRVTLTLPVNSEQTELVFQLGRGAAHTGSSTTELYITGVRQVVDNSLTRLKKSYGSRKNLLLNGNFDFWERQVATGVTVDATISDLYSADRWKRTSGGSTSKTLEVQRGEFGVQTIEGTPEKLESGNFPKYYINIKGTATDPLASNDFVALEQRIEDYRTLNHKNASLSFYAKGTAVGNFHVGLNRKGSGSQFYNVKEFRIEETGTWKKYTTTLVVPEVTFGYTNLEDTYLSLMFHTLVKGGERGYVGSADINYQGTLSIAQVQLEEGSRVTPFEHLSVAEELPLLQRYYWRDDGLILFHTDPNTNTADPCIFPVTMRAAPAEDKIRGGLVGFAGAGTAIRTKSISVDGIVNPGKRSYAWERSGSSSSNDTTVVGWDADAEL